MMDDIIQKIIELYLEQIANFIPNVCIHDNLVITLPKLTKYNNVRCFKQQGNVSGAYILQFGDQIILKGNSFKRNFNKDDIADIRIFLADEDVTRNFLNKLAIIKEMWINDYISRHISTHHTENIVDITNVFSCNKKIPLDPLQDEKNVSNTKI